MSTATTSPGSAVTVTRTPARPPQHELVPPASPEVVAAPAPVVPSRIARSAADRIAKRLIDVVVASISLIVLAPLLLVVALVVRVQDGGPVLFRQQRVGRDGVEFGMLKFRTMCVDAELRLADLLHRNEADGPLFKLRQDPRVTRVGNFLRRTSIDELPQLWNVMRGEMSLVGPRPSLPREVREWEPEAFGRLMVRPGLTGPWQISGRSDLGWEDGLRLDLDYVATWTATGDLVLLSRTIPRVLASHGAY